MSAIKYLLVPLIFMSTLCVANANSPDPSVVQFYSYQEDFTQQHFSLTEAMFFEHFLSTRCDDLSQYAEHSKNIPSPLKFKHECAGAINDLHYLDSHLFDWHIMWHTKNPKDYFILSILNEDLSAMNAELHGK